MTMTIAIAPLVWAYDRGFEVGEAHRLLGTGYHVPTYLSLVEDMPTFPETALIEDVEHLFRAGYLDGYRATSDEESS